MTFRLSEFAKIVGGTCLRDGEFSDFCIDSRKGKSGDLFICLKGARADGHDFIEKAAQNGVSALLIDRNVESDLPRVLVPDTLKALQDFASWYRTRPDLTVVAVTGSVGKTTTKEFIAAVLSQSFNTYKTQGNMNSETGLPLTLLHVAPTDTVAVTEMGMCNFGEISELSHIARPDIGVLTNIGLCHIEYLGSQEGILKAKMEIVDGMKDDGVLVINGDDPYLSTVNDTKQKRVWYGLNNSEFDYYAYNVRILEEGVSFTAKTPLGELDVNLAIDGIHNVYNSLAAIAVGVLSGMSLDAIGKGLSHMEKAPMRQNIRREKGMTLIEDCYNASPTSMKASIEVLKGKAGRKIAVLGDMLELGDRSEEYHRQVGEYLEGISVLIAYGNFAHAYVEGAASAGVLQRIPCKTPEEAAVNLKLVARKEDVVLFKASRGMHAEQVIEYFLNDKKEQEEL
ncbi:MAG: UDP-N-acetylmuramoyl-tripeptide--D-alanyl-D-alanine ligase [Clostridia bacterium]|nr:UDP-N-acetylmuramoyl-tripeptide--D-alanyl-D-alanine ligase [Clostridia bacterium]